MSLEDVFLQLTETPAAEETAPGRARVGRRRGNGPGRAKRRPCRRGQRPGAATAR